jgi:LysM repeat protein
MDRKKIIMTAVLINAGVLTLLFIAAMTMREEGGGHETPRMAAKDPKPIFNETAEMAACKEPAASAPIAALPTPPVAFTLPPVEEQNAIQPIPVEIPAQPVVAAQPTQTPSLIAQTPLAASQTSSNASSSLLEIEVQKGDSLEKLAKLHRTSVDEIIKLNQLPSSFLRAGQRLKIPAEKRIEAPKTKVIPAPSVSEQAEYYTMKVGDNPWSIAMKHHMKVDELLKLNGLNEKTARKLKPGDRLRIK